MFNRRTFGAFVLCASVSTAGLAQTTVLFNSFLPPGHPMNTHVFKPWTEEIAKATQGRVKVDIPPASLAAPPQQMDAAAKGIFDMAYQFHGFLENKVKLTQLAHLTGVNTNAKGSSVALWRTYEKYFQQVDEYKDVHVLGMFVFPPGVVFGMKKPIDSVADIKGVKMFALPGVAADVLGAAGAGVVAAPAVRSHEIISGGTVDAFAGYPIMDGSSFKTVQYAKHITEIPGGLNAPSFVLFVNKKKWGAMSLADREAITKLSGEALAQRMGAMDEFETKARAAAAAQGIQVKAASQSFAADLQKLAQPQVQSWLNDAKALGVDGAAALEFYKTQAQQASQ
jgi:TRAP-type C4-dicarboxylate transport system substrate-binding protein